MKKGIEIERKFVIKKPDISYLEGLDGFGKSEITQTYLESEPHITHRVRARAYRQSTEYTETKKVRIDRMSAVEDERVIDRNEYIALRGNIKRGSRELHKTRYTFLYEKRLFEVDVYPEWHGTCIMEVELDDENAAVAMPPFITVFAEVTGRKEYSNASMSMSFPAEIPLE